MADDDFDLESLAAYLHLQAAQVSRLVERGKLPGRRVAGQWRFSPAEIHHWLEERIAGSDAAELERMEGALENDVRPHEEPLATIAELLPLAAIDVPLPARTRNSAITSMVDVAARTGWLWDPEAMADAVRQREDLYPTALENGVALLHPRRPLPQILDRPFVAFGRTETGIPFASAQGWLTDLFFLICSASDRGHLHTLARLSRLLTDEGLLAELRAAGDANRVKELFTAAERSLME